MPKKAKPKTPDLSDIAASDGVGALTAKLREVRAARVETEASPLPGKFTAIHGYHKLEAEIIRHLAELAPPPAPSGDEAGPALSDRSDDELLDGLVSAVADLPDEALDRLEDALALRRTGKPRLSVVGAKP